MGKKLIRYYVYHGRSDRYFYSKAPRTIITGVRGPLYAILIRPKNRSAK